MTATPRTLKESIRGAVFTLRWGTSCGNCGSSLSVGDMARYDHDVLIGDQCCTDDPARPTRPSEDDDMPMPQHPVMPRGRTAADRCDRCFLVHSTGQVDCE